MKATHTPPTTTAEPGITPADLLHGAALYLTAHGWTQGQFFDLLADTDGPFPPACASGAIMTAATGRCLADGIYTLDGDDNPETIAAIRAMRVFAGFLDLEYSPAVSPISAIDVIGDWNDYDGRTLDEVVECLTDAANDWQTAHTTGGTR